MTTTSVEGASSDFVQKWCELVLEQVGTSGISQVRGFFGFLVRARVAAPQPLPPPPRPSSFAPLFAPLDLPPCSYSTFLAQVAGMSVVAISCIVLLALYYRRSAVDRAGLWGLYVYMLWFYLASSVIGIIAWSVYTHALVLSMQAVAEKNAGFTLFTSPLMAEAFQKYYPVFLFLYPLQFAFGSIGKLLVLYRFVASSCTERESCNEVQRRQVKRAAFMGLGGVVVLYTCQIVSMWVSAGFEMKGAAMMPAAAAQEQAVADVFNIYSNAFALSFVFESLCLILILVLFAYGYSLVKKQFDSIERSLQAVAQKNPRSAAKALVLEQGVHDMSVILSRTTALVFVAFLQHAAYDLMWTVATFGNVFKPGCQHPCDSSCYDKNGILNHAIRFTPSLVAIVLFLSVVVGPLVAIFGMTKGRIWCVSPSPPATVHLPARARPRASSFAGTCCATGTAQICSKRRRSIHFERRVRATCESIYIVLNN